MTTEAELLQAVAADLDDRGAWQVYLDWLLEREDPRAELFRLQLLEEDTDDERERKALGSQISDLFVEHMDRWLADVDALGLPVQWQMNRGVVGGVSGRPRDLAKHATAILAAAPLLMSVSINVDRSANDLAPLAGSPLLARARDLSLDGSVRVTGWQHLLGPEVRSLELSSLGLGPDDIAALATNFPKLQSLTTSRCRLNKSALEPLATWAVPNLERVDLTAGHVGPPLGTALGKFPALRSIRIAGNEIGSEGLAAMRSVLPQLTYLDLRGNKLVASDVPVLLKALKQVTVLKLGGNDLGKTGVEQIAAWPGAARLTHLDADHDSDREALALAHSTYLSTKLVKLTLGMSRVAEKVEHALLDAPNLANARIYIAMRMLGRKKREATLAKSTRVKVVKKPATATKKKKPRAK